MREARAARGAAAAAQAAAGRVVPTCAPGGWWSGACLARGAGCPAHGPREFAMKKAAAEEASSQ